MELIQDLGYIQYQGLSKSKARFGIFKCQCGNEFKTSFTSISRGHTKSCGCLKKKQLIDRNSIHGMKHHALYATWSGMMRRCNNSNYEHYLYYGGRGITVCDRWKDVVNFIEDMHPNYQERLTLDRINNDGNYEPSNCRWATRETQQRNTRRIRINNTSGHRGVSYSDKENKWRSRINISGKEIRIGSFNTAIEASHAYDNFVIENNLEHTMNSYEFLSTGEEVSPYKLKKDGQ